MSKLSADRQAIMDEVRHIARNCESPPYDRLAELAKKALQAGAFPTKADQLLRHWSWLQQDHPGPDLARNYWEEVVRVLSLRPPGATPVCSLSGLEIGDWTRQNEVWALAERLEAGEPEDVTPQQAEEDDSAGPVSPAAEQEDGGQESAGEPSSKPQEEQVSPLVPAAKKAYYSYSWAERKLTEAGYAKVTDRQAYDWFRDNGLPDEREATDLAGELEGYELPAFDTWSRQVRTARDVLRSQKYSRRAGRPTGRSVVRESEIENQRGD